jgi:hypothetical protein
LNLLINSIVLIDSLFTLQTLDYRPHVLSITSGNLEFDAKVKEKSRRCLELDNGITDLSFDLWNELGDHIILVRYGKNHTWKIEYQKRRESSGMADILVTRP